MITISNYQEKAKSIDFNSLDPVLRETHKSMDVFIELYHQDSDIKEAVDDYLEVLNNLMPLKEHPKSVVKPVEKKAVTRFKKGDWVKSADHVDPGKIIEIKYQDELKKHVHKVEWLDGEISSEIADNLTKTIAKKTSKKARKEPAGKKESSVKLVSEIEPEISIARRYAGFFGKQIEIRKAHALLKYLRQHVISGRISKVSELYPDIKNIESELQRIIAETRKVGGTHLKVADNAERKQYYSELGKSEKIQPSVNAIKSYIRIVGQDNVTERADKLVKLINRILSETPKDLHAHKLQEILDSLNKYLGKSKDAVPAEVAIAGIRKSVKRKAKGLSGVDQDIEMISARSLEDMTFDYLGLTGEWLDFLGNVTIPFSLMLHGLPGSGKSTLAVKFAGYLAKTLNKKVLYVAAEERFGATLQDKFARTNSFSDNITITRVLPEDLTRYDFVFIDSVNELELDPKAISDLITFNPSQCFVFVYRSTKGGDFRGEGEHENIVDISVKVEAGRTTMRKNRFGGSGQIIIY